MAGNSHTEHTFIVYLILFLSLQILNSSFIDLIIQYYIISVVNKNPKFGTIISHSSLAIGPQIFILSYSFIVSWKPYGSKAPLVVYLTQITVTTCLTCNYSCKIILV